jgi:epoxyqueuosine reductase
VSEPAARPRTLSERTKALALAVGFDLAGIADAVPHPETEFLRGWLARGFGGEMAYLARRVEARVDPRRVLEGARSIVAVGLFYDSARPAADSTRTAAIARYAGGDDYHDVMLDRLRALESGLAAMVEAPIASRAYVDTGPVQERVFAAYAGLGWIGKNTCLIHPTHGSYLFLGVLLTDLALEPDAREPDHCGTCRACLDACPTDAFAAPYELDATRCISYATIEARGPIPESMRVEHGNWVFCCDVCQEVCPWNLRERRELPPDPIGLRERIAPRAQWVRPSIEWILELDEEAWRAATRKTAMRRTRHAGLIRNALVAAGNTRDASLEKSIRRHLESPDPAIAEHARWALGQLSSGSPASLWHPS